MAGTLGVCVVAKLTARCHPRANGDLARSGAKSWEISAFAGVTGECLSIPQIHFLPLFPHVVGLGLQPSLEIRLLDIPVGRYVLE